MLLFPFVQYMRPVSSGCFCFCWHASRSRAERWTVECATCFFLYFSIYLIILRGIKSTEICYIDIFKASVHASTDNHRLIFNEFCFAQLYRNIQGNAAWMVTSVDLEKHVSFSSWVNFNFCCRLIGKNLRKSVQVRKMFSKKKQSILIWQK